MSLFDKVLSRTAGVLTLVYQLVMVAIMLGILSFMGYCAYVGATS